MSPAEALALVKALASEQAFAAQGDPIFALGARVMDDVSLNHALVQATGCERGIGVWVVRTVDIWNDEMIVALRFDPPTIVSIGPSR